MTTPPNFWREAFALHGSVTPRVLTDVLTAGLAAAAVCAATWVTERQAGVHLALEVTPFELAGAALGLLLILRTNAGYDRWWEARKLWGGIVNQSRNLAVGAVAYGPADPAWRAAFLRWAVAFPHVARGSLRGEPPPPELAGAVHPPTAVVLELAHLLRQARDRFGMDGWAFAQVDRERAALLDHLGGCERILKTPLPLVYAIKVRRFIALFLLTLPFALLHRTDDDWLIPLLTMMVAYPLLSLDRIGAELQNPFATANLSHLPLNDITATIERNVTGLLADVTRPPPAGSITGTPPRS